MKPLIALILIAGTALATQAFGVDTMPQPLTRADCEAASDRLWSETANVCESGAKGALALKPQPLARSDCEQAGMWWNDNALVCDDASARKTTSRGGLISLSRKQIVITDRKGLKAAANGIYHQAEKPG